MTDFATVQNITDAMAMSCCNHAGLGAHVPLFKSSMTTVANLYYSGWASNGYPAYVGTGTIPTTAAVCTQATQGAGARWAATPAGKTTRLLEFRSQLASQMTVIFYDRLCHMGGLSANLNTAQTVNLDLVTVSADGRCASDGSDVEWFVEVFAAGGTTNSVNFTVNYTKEDGTTGRVSQAHTLAASGWPLGRLYPIYLMASGDKGIKSIQSITINTASGTAGNIGIVAAKRLFQPETLRLAYHFQNVSSGTLKGTGSIDAFLLGMPKLLNNMCLWRVEIGYTTSNSPFPYDLVIGAN